MYAPCTINRVQCLLLNQDWAKFIMMLMTPELCSTHQYLHATKSFSDPFHTFSFTMQSDDQNSSLSLIILLIWFLDLVQGTRTSWCKEITNLMGKSRFSDKLPREISSCTPASQIEIQGHNTLECRKGEGGWQKVNRTQCMWNVSWSCRVRGFVLTSFLVTYKAHVCTIQDWLFTWYIAFQMSPISIVL